VVDVGDGFELLPMVLVLYDVVIHESDSKDHKRARDHYQLLLVGEQSSMTEV
jgi:hypothetical protein